MTTSAKVLLSVEAMEVLTSGLKAGIVPSKFLEELDLRNGTTDGKIDLVYCATTSAIAASATTTYNLRALTDSYGTAVVFAEVVLLLIRNKRSTALAYLEVGPNAATGFGTLTASKGIWAAANDRSIIAPEGWYCHYDKAGCTCSAALKDLDITASAVVGNTNTWDILILGRSA